MSVAIQAYYDGSGSPAADHRGAVITLAGYVATPEVWAAFESDWRAVLDDASGRPTCSCLHMADAKALQGDFSPELGWTEQGVDVLIGALFNRCFSPRGMHVDLTNALVGAACSVDLEAYARVCQQYPHFSEKLPEALCVDHVVGVAIQRLVGDQDRMAWEDLHSRRQSIELFFDRNEPFRHQIQRVWQARRWKHRTKPLKLVHNIQGSDRHTPPLQAADFLAWHANRDMCSESGDLEARMMASLSARCAVIRYDYDTLKSTAARWRSDGGYEAVAADEVA